MTDDAPPRTYSLKSQLLFWLLIPLFVISAVALFDAWRSARATADDILDRVLSGSVLAIAERVVVSDNGRLEIDIPYVALEMLTSSAQDRVFYKVARPDGTFITGYEALPVPASMEPELGKIGFADGRFLGSDIRLAVYSGAASTGLASVEFLVAVAETTNARVGLAQSIFLRSALRQAVLLIAAPLVIWFAVTRALRPLYGLRDAIGRRSQDDLRPIIRPVPAEMAGLLDSTNGFLARLRSAVGALRRFTGNASHQLRTPLAIIRTELALAARAQGLEDARRHAGAADRAAQQAGRILAQLLVLARIDEAASKSPDDRITDISAVARAVVSDHVRAADAAGIDLGFEGESEVRARCDEMLATEMIGNLVENAINYAGTGSVVSVRSYSRADAAVIEVADDGPGIDDRMKPAVLERFNRGEAETRDGAGLGLSVVAEIAELYAGTVELLDSPAGGLLARVALPRLPRPAAAGEAGTGSARNTAPRAGAFQYSGKRSPTRN